MGNPRRLLDGAEEPVAAGRRELLEETGFGGGEARLLGAVWPNPAVQNNRCHFVLIEGVSRVAELAWDEHEEIESIHLPVDEVLTRARAGEILHALTLTALFLFEPHWRNRALPRPFDRTAGRPYLRNQPVSAPSLSSLLVPRFANAGLAVGATGGGVLPGELESEVRAIYGRSPIYTRRRPLHAAPLRWACYDDIPLLTKKEIVEEGHCAFFDDCQAVDRGIAASRLERETTSGTTTAPMTVIMEQGWWTEQTRRAYRAHPVLAEFADRPHRKAVLAPVNCSSNLCPYEDFPFPNRWFDGTVYLNLSSDPFCFTEVEWDRIVTEIQATKPEILEGEPVYLALLARAVRHRAVAVPSLRAIILTYGKASLVHSRRIAEAFPVPQVDLYGSTEAGYLFVGDAFADNSRAIDANAFLELEPVSAVLPDVFRVIVTTRGREAMPLLRYLSGDAVLRTPTGFRVLGRERDLSFRPDGSLLTTLDLDRALPAGWVCWHYCLRQVSVDRWNFEYVADHTAPKGVAEALVAVLGGGVRVNLFRKRLLPPAPSGKFALLKPLVNSG